MENFNNKKALPLVDMTKCQAKLSQHHKLLSVLWGGMLGASCIAGVVFSAENIIRLGFQLVNDPASGLYFTVFNLLPIFLIIAIIVNITDEGAERYLYLHPIDSQNSKDWTEMSGILIDKIQLYEENEYEIYRENLKKLIVTLAEIIILLIFANYNAFAIADENTLMVFCGLVFIYSLMELLYRTVYRKIKLNEIK